MYLSFSCFANRIAICPPLLIRVVISVGVITEAAVEGSFFPGKALEVLLGKGTVGGEEAAEGVVAVFGDDGLRGVDERCGIVV